MKDYFVFIVALLVNALFDPYLTLHINSAFIGSTIAGNPSFDRAPSCISKLNRHNQLLFTLQL